MKVGWFACAGLLCIGVAAFAQTPEIIPMSAEPNHHRALGNEYVNVYEVQVPPHQSVVLHRHDYDAVSVMLADSQVTVRTPNKPEVHAKLTGGQVRLQPRGYTHLTYIDDATTYRNVTVELLRPQQNLRNLCASVVAGQELNCSAPPASGAPQIDQPQFQTDQTKVTLTRLLPHQTMMLESSSRQGLLVMLDEAVVIGGKGSAPDKLLHSGDFMWFERDSQVRALKNNTDKECRFVWFALSP